MKNTKDKTINMKEKPAFKKRLHQNGILEKEKPIKGKDKNNL